MSLKNKILEFVRKFSKYSIIASLSAAVDWMVLPSQHQWDYPMLSQTLARVSGGLFLCRQQIWSFKSNEKARHCSGASLHYSLYNQLANINLFIICHSRIAGVNVYISNYWSMDPSYF